MKLIGLERNGTQEQAILNMMGFKPLEPEEENTKLPKDKQPTLMEKRGLSKREWAESRKGVERGVLRLQRDLERQGLTHGKPVVGVSFEPNRIFA